MTKSRPLRYIVEIPGESIPASYNTGLGEREAKTYAVHTASRYHGIISLENVDGTVQTVKDYRPKTRDSFESVENKV